MPVIPGTSLRLPTRYQAQKVATGAAWTSRSSTTRPFDSTLRVVGSMRLLPVSAALPVRTVFRRAKHGSAGHPGIALPFGPIDMPPCHQERRGEGHLFPVE